MGERRLQTISDSTEELFDTKGTTERQKRDKDKVTVCVGVGGWAETRMSGESGCGRGVCGTQGGSETLCIRRQTGGIFINLL